MSIADDYKGEIYQQTLRGPRWLQKWTENYTYHYEVSITLLLLLTLF